MIFLNSPLDNVAKISTPPTSSAAASSPMSGTITSPPILPSAEEHPRTASFPSRNRSADSPRNGLTPISCLRSNAVSLQTVSL